MSKPKVAVIFGSRSTEHDVSIVTAIASVIKPLRLLDEYKVVPVYIAKDGQWFSHPKLAEIKTFTSGEIDNLLTKLKPLTLQLGGGLKLVEPGLRGKTTKIDVVFPATHGTHGEDGELPALFQLADIPFVGCGMQASAVAMNKILAKQVAAANGISTPKYANYLKKEYEANSKNCLKEIESTLTYPLFVKPPHLGSSVAISKVSSAGELTNAIEVALHYDDSVLIEEAVNNLVEVTLPVMGNDEPVPALLEQPLVSAEDFFDFDTKYMKGGKKGKTGGQKGENGAQGYSKIPADLPKELYRKAEQTGLDVYKALGCSGIARVDMLIDQKAGQVYFNEVNPLPGSLYSHNWNKAGISNVELVQKLIDFAKERFEKNQKTDTAFSTNYLKQF